MRGPRFWGELFAQILFSKLNAFLEGFGVLNFEEGAKVLLLFDFHGFPTGFGS